MTLFPTVRFTTTAQSVAVAFTAMPITLYPTVLFTAIAQLTVAVFTATPTTNYPTVCFTATAHNSAVESSSTPAAANIPTATWLKTRRQVTEAAFTTTTAPQHSPTVFSGATSEATTSSTASATDRAITTTAPTAPWREATMEPATSTSPMITTELIPRYFTCVSSTLPTTISNCSPRPSALTRAIPQRQSETSTSSAIRD